jgi:hypothetical protein
MREKMRTRLEWHIGGVNRESGFCFSFSVLSSHIMSVDQFPAPSQSQLGEGAKWLFCNFPSCTISPFFVSGRNFFPFCSGLGFFWPLSFSPPQRYLGFNSASDVLLYGWWERDETRHLAGLRGMVWWIQSSSRWPVGCSAEWDGSETSGWVGWMGGWLARQMELGGWTMDGGIVCDDVVCVCICTGISSYF